VDGTLVLSQDYLATGDKVSLYLDLVHELTHVRQFREARTSTTAGTPTSTDPPRLRRTRSRSPKRGGSKPFEIHRVGSLEDSRRSIRAARFGDRDLVRLNLGGSVDVGVPAVVEVLALAKLADVRQLVDEVEVELTLSPVAR